MDLKKYVARFMVHKVGSFVVKERVLCFGERDFSTYDPESQLLTNTWSYDDVESASPIDGETDFIILTPRHRIKKTVFRCHYRMEVLVCLMRLRSQHQSRLPGRAVRPELQIHAFSCIKYHKRGLQSSCVVEIRPDGIYQKDDEGEVMSHIPYTSLVSIDIICDHHDAILLNHADNSSLFIVDRRTEMAQAIHRIMRAYGMGINEYRKKTMEAASKDDTGTTLSEGLSFQYPVTRISSTNKPIAPRILSVSEKYIAELTEDEAVVTSRPLSRIYSLIVLDHPTDAFEIVYVDGVRRTFHSVHREKIVCELLSSCHAINNLQVEVVTTRVPDSVRMVPRKIIQTEGAKLIGTIRDGSVMDRELRGVQTSILQQMASYGSSKTARSQRRLPQGVDDQMHTLAVELNANTPTSGVIPQPNKPFDKVVYYIAREIRDVVARHGSQHHFISTYLQTLFRLLQAPPAMGEFVGILLERGGEYLSTIANILAGRSPVSVYWMLMVLNRLAESRTHKFQTREIFISNGSFLVSLLSLFDMDSKSQRYLSDLPTMKLTQLVLCLVKTNPERQQSLSKALYEHLARKYRMLQRILFGFPSLTTVESCVGILSRMINNPPSVVFDGGDGGDAGFPSRVGQPPPLSLTFGENLSFELAAPRSGGLSGRLGILPRRNSGRLPRMTPPASGTTQPSRVTLQNPEILLRQYRQFLESPCGSLKRSMTQLSDALFLRLRYRCRNVFLQELMSHLVGNIEEIRRTFVLDCHHFSGFLGKTSGQREKSEIYLTPRALIAVRVMNRYTHEFEYRSMQLIHIALEFRDAIAINTNGKLRYIYSDACPAIVQKMRELAGAIGIQLACAQAEQLPKQGNRSPGRQGSRRDRISDEGSLSVMKRTGRHGSSRLRKKRLLFDEGTIREIDPDTGKEKMYHLKALQRVVTRKPGLEEEGSLVALDFVNGQRVAYWSTDVDVFLAKLYDGCVHEESHAVTFGSEFSRVNPRLTTRALLRDDMERYMYLGKDGFYVMSHAEIMKELERMKNEGLPSTSSMDKVMFSLENVNLSVDTSDFRTEILETRIAQLDLKAVSNGLSTLLQHSSKSPMRISEICIILEAFCRINDGTYRLVQVEEDRITEFVDLLLKVIGADDELAVFWAVKAFHSILSDGTQSRSGQAVEKHARSIVLSKECVIEELIKVVDGSFQLCSLAALDLFRDVMVKSRSSTDNNHFDALVKRLGARYDRLLRLAVRDSVVGSAIGSLAIIKVILDHGDPANRGRICDTALANGVTIQALYHAFFEETDVARDAYRFIATMWVGNHRPSYELLTRMLPQGFIRLISAPVSRKLLQDNRNGTKHDENGRRRRDRQSQKPERFVKRVCRELLNNQPIILGRQVKAKEDTSRSIYPGDHATHLSMLAELVQRDFELPDLIWNSSTREELRLAMQRCVQLIHERLPHWSSHMRHKTLPEAPMPVVWNHLQFAVTYPTLDRELQVDQYYLRILLGFVRDGSLQLGQVSGVWEAMNTSNNTDANIDHNSREFNLVFSAATLAANPTRFFIEVYQRWLERLHVAGPKNRPERFLRLSLTEASLPADEDSDLLLKTLIEMAKAFPTVRTSSSSRMQFLVDAVANSFTSPLVEGVIDLVSQLSCDPVSSRFLIKKRFISFFVFMATLCHRCKLSRQASDVVSDEGDVPVVGLDCIPEISSVSSVPMTHLSLGASRLHLKWRVKWANEDEVAGPFSPIDLKQFVDDLPSLSLPDQDLMVCCCTIHEKHDSPDHEWHAIGEVPELRWMELMDEPIDPNKLGLRALQIIRNVIVNEPAAVSDGLCVMPLPHGKQLLTLEENVAQITQLLLVESHSVRKLACEILLSLGPAVAQTLYRYGLFFFLFATSFESTDGDERRFVEEARLLHQCHRLQESREARAGHSYLIGILPEALVALLDNDSPEKFADVFTGRQPDSRVLWTPAMRNHLRSMVREHIEEFEEDLSRDIAATYCYVSLPPVKYMELSRDVYCGGYYLSTIAESHESSLESVEDPQLLMAAIEDKWRSLVQRQSANLDGVQQDCAGALKIFGWDRHRSFNMVELRGRYRDLCKKGAEITTVRSAYEVLSTLLERRTEAESGRTSSDVVLWILKALLRLLDRFSFQLFSFESKALDLLLGLVGSKDRSFTSETKIHDDDVFRELGIRILHQLLLAAPRNVERLLAISHSWDTLLDLVESYAFSGDSRGKLSAFSIIQLVVSAERGPDSLLGEPVSVNLGGSRSFLRMESYTSEENDHAFSFLNTGLDHDTRESPQSKRLCSLIDHLLSSADRRQSWKVQQCLFATVSSMCRNRALQNQLVLGSKIFWRALYLLLSTAEGHASPASPSNLDDDTVAKEERNIVEAAFVALRSLSIGDNGIVKSRALDALACLLPLAFLDSLERPTGHDFWTVLASDIREPGCIWNEHTRSELLQVITEHCSDESDDELSFLESASSYMYDCLSSEPLVGGIYLRVLIEKAENDPDSLTDESLAPSTALDFMEALFIFLNENRDPSLGIYADTLPALECLNLLIDIPLFRSALVDSLERYADKEDAELESVSIATLGRYLLPYDRADHNGMKSISSRRSLSSYGFMSRNGKNPELDGLPEGMEAEFGNVDYLNRQEFALLILNKICGMSYDLEMILAPFCRYTWSLQVIADHLDYEQAFYALSCLAELCDTCRVVAEYVDKSGLWVEILGIALQSRQHVLHEHFLRAEALREPAFEVLYSLLNKDQDICEDMYSGLCKFLPYPIVFQIHLDPSMATKFFDDDHDKGDLIWNSEWRTEVRRKLDIAICRNRIERSKAKRDSVILDDEDFVEVPHDFIGGLYLDRFLARPDPNELTNPSYVIHLLFQEWKEKLLCIMEIDLENPQEHLKDLADEVEKLTSAMAHILRAVQIDDFLDRIRMPDDIVKLVRISNKEVVRGFAYRCILKIARLLTQFPEILSADFIEMLICRITTDDPDIPALTKLLRRILEARSQQADENLVDTPFKLSELQYYSDMVRYLESVVERKNMDAKVLSNINRILRIVKAEVRADSQPMSQAFFSRASHRWLNATVHEAKSSRVEPTQPIPIEVDIDMMASYSRTSFDVDREHNPSENGTFNVDDERAVAALVDNGPPSRHIFDGESIQEVPPAPPSFRHVRGNDESGITPPARASVIRAMHEPVDSKYHSIKAAEYDRLEDEADMSRRVSMSSLIAADAESVDIDAMRSDITTTSRFSFVPSFLRSSRMPMTEDPRGSRRYSLMDSWRAPTSNKPNPLLQNMTISRRGRRAAANDLKRKRASSNKWFR
ncbi:hypothetical protein PINS_up003027 [Pythium insidiosum]|nr:hypothetical protein PINS_up003027 [Pythium insidiosum]